MTTAMFDCTLLVISSTAPRSVPGPCNLRRLQPDEQHDAKGMHRRCVSSHGLEGNYAKQRYNQQCKAYQASRQACSPSSIPTPYWRTQLRKVGAPGRRRSAPASSVGAFNLDTFIDLASDETTLHICTAQSSEGMITQLSPFAIIKTSFTGNRISYVVECSVHYEALFSCMVRYFRYSFTGNLL